MYSCIIFVKGKNKRRMMRVDYEKRKKRDCNMLTFNVSDPGLRDCVHNVVHTGIGDGTYPTPYLCCTLLVCEVELVDTEGSNSSYTRVRFLSYCQTRIHVTLSSRIYKGGQ
jgi:hypothetical protein